MLQQISRKDESMNDDGHAAPPSTPLGLDNAEGLHECHDLAAELVKRLVDLVAASIKEVGLTRDNVEDTPPPGFST